MTKSANILPKCPGASCYVLSFVRQVQMASVAIERLHETWQHPMRRPWRLWGTTPSMDTGLKNQQHNLGSLDPWVHILMVGHWIINLCLSFVTLYGSKYCTVYSMIQVKCEVLFSHFSSSPSHWFTKQSCCLVLLKFNCIVYKNTRVFKAQQFDTNPMLITENIKTKPLDLIQLSFHWVQHIHHSSFSPFIQSPKRDTSQTEQQTLPLFLVKPSISA